MDFTLTFIELFFRAIYLTAPLLLFLLLVVVSIGMLVGAIEKWDKFDALYWTFITVTTVGYGDFRPLKKSSKILAVMLAFIGLMFTGIIVALTVHTATLSFEQHIISDKYTIAQTL